MQRKIDEKESGSLKGRIRTITTKAGTGEVLRISDWNRNRIMLGTNTGKSLILQRLIGENTYTLNINKAEIGTGSTTPADGDVALTTPTVRVDLANASYSGDTASLFFFFADGVLANGTYYEFGTFIDGDASLSNGQIFNHALFSVAYTKNTGEDTTVQLDIELT